MSRYPSEGVARFDQQFRETDREKRERFLARHKSLAKDDERPARGSRDMIEIAGEITARHPGGKAVKFYDGKRTEWVPLSQIKNNDDGTFSMPEWLAKDKGFI